MPQSTSGTEVLIVEDESELRTLYESWLSDDYLVEVAADGKSAYEIFNNGIEVVLLDRKLPDLDGEQLVPRLRSHHPDCQIAMVTSVEPEWRILEMEIDAYITKPVRDQDLRHLVEALSERDYQSLAEHEKITL